MSAATASPTPTSNNAMTDSLSDNEMNNSIESSAVRKRTRATAEQLAVLEDTFAANVSPNSKLRKQLSERLQMSERSIQIWFQNRRAKVKHMQKRAQMQMQQASIRAQLYHYHQQQYGMHPTPPPHPQQQPYPIMPLPQQQQQQYNHHPHHPHHRVPLPAAAVRAQSVDTSMNPTPPASITSSSSTDSPSSSLDSLHNLPPSHHLSNTATTTTSYPLQENMDFPDYLNGGPLSPSPSPHHDFQSVPLSHPLDNSNDNGMTTSSTALPTLVSVPDAGPTAMLTTGSSSSSPSNDHLMSTPATTPPTSLVEQPTVSPQDIWPASIYHTNLMRSQSVAAIPMATSNSEFSSTHLERSLSNPPVTTIDPSNLMMNHRLSATPPVENATISTTTQENNTDNNNKSIHTNDSSSNSSSEIYDVYLNCTTLTIGTWHRLKLRASDLLCVLKDNVFEWHIEDAGCHFKMEIALSSVASIDFVEESNGLADVHFDISESPLFYMETTNNNNNNNNENNTSASSSTWVQCSDFTEGKQASRFFRHSLKGVSQHLKQDLMTLMDKCPDARRWVRFLDPLSSTTNTHPHQHQHTTSHFQPSYPLTTFDPMLTTGTHPFNSSNPLMATTMTPPPPPPPSHPNASSYLHPSYWSSMYSQTPMMMGVSNYLV